MTSDILALPQILRKAARVAMSNQNAIHKIGAVIYNKRMRVISIGYNTYGKTHPVQKKYALRLGIHEKEYIHAEIHAIIKCSGKPYFMTIARVTRGNNIGIAKPCIICQLAIADAGIEEKNIQYTL